MSKLNTDRNRNQNAPAAPIFSRSPIQRVKAGLLLTAFALVLAQTVRATLLDSTGGLGQFNYANNAAASSQYFTTGGNGASGGPVYLTASRMTKLGYNTGFGFFPASAAGLNYPATSSSANKIRTHLLSSGSGGTASGTVYMSFLLRVNSAPSSGVRGFISLGSNTGSQSQVSKSVWAMINSSGQLAIAKQSVTAADATLTTTNLVGTGVHLVVVAYTFTNAVGTDDIINLWLDPALSTFGAAEGTVTADLTAAPAVTDADAIRCVVLANGPSANGGNIEVDEVRVGTTWADILPTPTTCVLPDVTNTSPAAITINEGLAVTLNSTTMAGDDNGNPATLQWQRWDGSSSWTNIPNATNASYTSPILSVAADNGAQYRVYASTVCSSYSTNSATNTLTVISCDNVAVTTSPASSTNLIGASASLSVGVSGSLPIYQWQKWDGVSTWTNIPSATSSNYTTPALQLSDSGSQYRCSVTSGCNASSTNSGVAIVTVTCGNAAVASNPASTTTTVGAPAIFTVGYGGPLPTYQWQSSTDGGATFGDLSGETSATYTNLSAASSSPSLQYRCILTAACSSTTATSTPAILTVVAPSAAKFRSVASGNWSAPATWQCSYDGGTTWTNTYAAPSDANDTIQVRSPHNVAVDSSISIDQATLDAGGILTVNSNNTLTISGAGTQLDISGTLISAGTVTPTGDLVFEAGGKYQHNWTTSLSGGIPTATWKTNSTCEVIGFTTPTGTWTAGNLSQSFYNFTWDCANYVGGSQIVLNHGLTNVSGDFKHKHGNLTLGGPSGSTTLRVGGNASFEAPIAFGYFIFGSSTDIQDLSIGGYLSILSGTRVDPGNPGYHTITFTGTNCFYTNAAGSRFDSHEVQINWAVAPGAKLTLATPIISGSTAVNGFRTVAVDGSLDLNGNNLTALEIKGGSTGIITNSSATAAKALLGAGGGGGGFVSLPDSFDGAINGNISVVKQGLTTVTLNGTNTYTGITTVTNGTLLVNGSLEAASTVAVSEVGTLGGVGTIGGNTTISGTGILYAGTNGNGKLTFGGDLTLDAAATSSFSVVAGSGTNGVHVTGQLSPNSSVLNITSGSPLAVGTYPLFTHYGTITGSFNATPVFDVAPADTATIVDTGSQINLVIGTIPVGPSGPGTITNSVSGSTLTLTWPAGQGWRLVGQTNSRSIGLNTNWATVPGVSDGSATITIDKLNPTVFYRLVYP